MQELHRSSSNSWRRLQHAGVVTVSLLTWTACGDDDSNDGGGVVVVDPNRDGGAGQGGGGSGGSQDGGPDGSVGDDSGTPTGDASVDPSCQLSDEEGELTQAAQFGDEYGFSVAPASPGFGLSYQLDDCNALATLKVVATGPYATPNMLFGDCAHTIRDISLLYIGSGYRLIWVDNSSGSMELQKLDLNSALEIPQGAMPAAMTANQYWEKRPVQWALGSKHYVGWLGTDANSDPNGIMVQDSDQTGSGSAVVAASAGFKPSSLSFAQLGTDHAGLAFIDQEPRTDVEEAKKKGIWFVPLDSTATPTGDPVLLSAAVEVGNTVDLATREKDGGAVVYSIYQGGAYEVRFRRLDAQAGFIGNEVKLAVDPLKATAAGVARLGDGFVIAFRNAPAQGATVGEIRLMFITKEGTVQRDAAGRAISYHVTDANTTGGRVSVRISTDGQLLISFLDDDGTGKKLRVLRKRLDCAL